MRREAELAELADGAVVDLLVVGLGVTGAGVALDAASRGLSVAACDMEDLAFGTSRWSSKLVHGGLRYLASLDVAVAFECARERGILMATTAPHLVRPLRVVMPYTNGVSARAARLFRAGAMAGDALRLAAGTTSTLLPRSRRLSPTQTLALVPGLRIDGLRGATANWDGQLEDDARLVTAIARTAAGHGARILTRCRVLTLAGDGATVRDERTGAEFSIRARTVVNATGVWAGQLVDSVRLRPSRGTHIVLPAERMGGLHAEFTLPVPGQRGRFAFAIPHPDGLVHVGITDDPVTGPVEDVPSVPEADIAFLLDVLGSALSVPPRREDVVGAFAGLRPLLDDGNDRTSDVSRRHAIMTAPDGVVTVVGGKLTTYRRMAAQAVDTAARTLNNGARRSRLDPPRSHTARLPLVGAASRTRLAALEAPERLIRRYGTEAPAVAALASADPDLGAQLAPGVDATGAELMWALQHEGAMTVDDLLDRRTRIGLVPAQRAAALGAAEAILARVSSRGV